MLKIDSRQYNGQCTCGRTHVMETQAAVVEAGCLGKFEEYLAEYGIAGFRTVIYDENTYDAEGVIRPAADQEIVLSPDGLHANEHGVAMVMEQLSDQAEVLVAIGSGTIHDITRYCAYLKGVPFVSCPTAASVDGFCSSVAAMTWKGCKKTLTCVAPRIVLADVDVIKNAPLYLAKSGFGDMIGKYVALTDWKMASILTGEFYCDRIAKLTADATDQVLQSAEGILTGDPDAYGKLVYGLLLSGIAMQMMGNSRPASGAEHHISHCIEMRPEGLGVSSEALHGEKVGVGTILAAREYRRLAKLENVSFVDYAPYTPEFLEPVFGGRLMDEIVAENANDCALGITGEQLAQHWDAMRAEIAKMPTAEYLQELYEKLQIKSRLSDIEVSDDKEQQLLTYCPCIRNRLTLMRLRKCFR